MQTTATLILCAPIWPGGQDCKEVAKKANSGVFEGTETEGVPGPL